MRNKSKFKQPKAAYRCIQTDNHKIRGSSINRINLNFLRTLGERGS